METNAKIEQALLVSEKQLKQFDQDFLETKAPSQKIDSVALPGVISGVRNP